MSVENETSTAQFKKAELSIEGRIEFGPANIAPVPRPHINIVDQVRTNFDPSGITELADSMVIYGDDRSRVVGFDMHNPLIVAQLTTDQAQDYLSDHAAFYKLECPASAITSPDGFTYILIAGERRILAIDKNVADLGIDIGRVDVMCSIQNGIKFLPARHKQMTENIHQRTSPVEEARNIRLTHDYLTLRYPDRVITIREIAEVSGRGETVVRQALAFTSLPKEIQGMAKKTELEYMSGGRLKKRYFTPIPYSVAVSLKPLEEALRLKHQLRGIEEPEEEYVKNHLLAFANSIQQTRMELKTKGKSRVSARIRKTIDEKIRNVLGEASFDMDAFFIEGEEPERSSANLKRAQLSLARTAIHTLELLRRAEAIDRDTAAMLEEVFIRIAASDKAIAEVIDEA